jgi:anti-sigma factor RsiW
MTMHCTHFHENLFAYHEGSLSDEMHQSLKDHLSSCDACVRLSAEFENLSNLIDKERVSEPSPFVKTRILQRIESEFEHPETRKIPVFVRILQPALIASALLAGILLGSYSAKTGHASDDQLLSKTDHIEFLKTDLYISEMMDEDKILVLNK